MTNDDGMFIIEADERLTHGEWYLYDTRTRRIMAVAPPCAPPCAPTDEWPIDRGCDE